ncbi:glycosyltransferase [Providencia rettgeri]|uniref:glycosyltransferase n=1 Tax=Providencia TaxID=586 RepID=UPI0018E4C484|nr:MULTISPECIES: glycosyltransferase [Providencia]EJD6477299.1 glycosyltransferase [Providencia rettgeri]ELR5065666.1 glycosyltransferase [Providencia rettgeri]ELR5166194.1 glycosyltransferase [Providencia rettgeri]MBI6194336.1 glycosyltransferase [Providencia rettgeri]UPQ39336.1 glycosyltransferase [Providencia rettgeri]
MKQPKLAPVVLFVYNRPMHTKQTIDALLQNPEASFTDLIVYSDAAKNSVHIDAVNQVRNIIKKTSGFNKITLVEREKNFGLAQNIIDGVTKINNEYGKVIVLEDDIVTSPSFLNFMNAALEKYKNSPEIWHISGWNYPLECNSNSPETFFWRTMNCWGWATWNDRWINFEKKPKKIIETWEKESINRFNLDGANNFFSQIEDNLNNRLNTWAIFWYATIFLHNGLCLNPLNSFVDNIGNDGSGENCGSVDIYKTRLNCTKNYFWPSSLEENKNITNLIKNFYYSTNPTILKRIIMKIKRVLVL